jgi:hypothetical protein
MKGRAVWAASIGVLMITLIFEPNKALARVIPPSPENAPAFDLKVISIDERTNEVAFPKDGDIASNGWSTSAEVEAEIASWYDARRSPKRRPRRGG